MKLFRTSVTWGLAFLALLLSPIVVIFGIPLVCGIGLDILDLAGAGPLALALGVSVAVVLFYRAAPRQPIVNFFRSRLHFGHTAGLGYTPKSMS
jgi:hypothetical protein